jgi:hypothetical protein
MPTRKPTKRKVEKTVNASGSRTKTTTKTTRGGAKVIKSKSVVPKKVAEKISEVPNKRLMSGTKKVISSDGSIGTKRFSNVGKSSYVSSNDYTGNQKKNYMKMKRGS